MTASISTNVAAVELDSFPVTTRLVSVTGPTSDNPISRDMDGDGINEIGVFCRQAPPEGPEVGDSLPETLRVTVSGTENPTGSFRGTGDITYIFTGSDIDGEERLVVPAQRAILRRPPRTPNVIIIDARDTVSFDNPTEDDFTSASNETFSARYSVNTIRDGRFFTGRLIETSTTTEKTTGLTATCRFEYEILGPVVVDLDRPPPPSIIESATDTVFRALRSFALRNRTRTVDPVNSRNIRDVAFGVRNWSQP